MILIESKDNPRYKALLALKKARQAKKEQLMILEGPRPLADLAAAGHLPRTLYFSQDDKGDRAARELLGPGGVFEGKMDPDQLIRLPNTVISVGGGVPGVPSHGLLAGFDGVTGAGLHRHGDNTSGWAPPAGQPAAGDSTHACPASARLAEPEVRDASIASSSARPPGSTARV